LDSDEDDDTDSQGVGLTRRGTRFVSDSLRFTGTDLGDRQSGLARRVPLGGLDNGETESEEDDEDDYDLALLTPEQKEEALVRTAMARIKRAQARGRSDVSLTKDELAALERRKQRMQEEADKRERRKSRKQRVAIPLTNLEPVSRKKKSSPPVLEAPPHDLPEAPDRQGYPPTGYFPPPSGRSRPRSGTTLSSRPPSRAHSDRPDSPFQYEYVQRPSSSTGRHVSDVIPRPLSARSHQYDDGSSASLSSSSRNQVDPFMFQTAGPRAAYPGGAAAASRRHVSGPVDGLYMTHRDEARTSHNGRRLAYDEASEESEPSESASDELNNGARIREPTRGGRSEIVVQPDLEPEPVPKKKSSESSKRKPVPSSSSGRGGRRKKK
jgi:hypothetical protein